MGVAAYNRGTALLRRQLTADQRPVEFEIMDRLNGLPKYPDAGTPFTSVRFGSSHNGWWIYGDDGFGYWYPTLHEAVRRWCVVVVGFINGEWTAEIDTELKGGK